MNEVSTEINYLHKSLSAALEGVRSKEYPTKKNFHLKMANTAETCHDSTIYIKLVKNSK